MLPPSEYNNQCRLITIVINNSVGVTNNDVTVQFMWNGFMCRWTSKTECAVKKRGKNKCKLIRSKYNTRIAIFLGNYIHKYFQKEQVNDASVLWFADWRKVMYGYRMLICLRSTDLETSMAVQWLRLSFQCRGCDSIPDWGAKIPYALWPKNQKHKNRSSIVINSIKTLKMVLF